MEHEITRQDEFVPSVVNAIPGEALSPTQKLIVRLRGVRESSHLTIPQIETMVNKSVSKTTLYRFFEEDSEIKYKFTQYTIEALMMALLVEDTHGDDLAIEKAGGFEAALQQKDEEIFGYQRQIEQLKSEHEKKCEEYERRLALWQHQVEIGRAHV